VLTYCRYLRELEEQISRSGASVQHANLEVNALGDTLFTGDENDDVPSTPHALLANQDTRWRTDPNGMPREPALSIKLQD
jgi:hypothetical protein